MFIGHYAVAFAAKKAVPKVSLGMLMLATSFLDVLWPVFLLIGWEQVRIDPGNTAFVPLAFDHYPISHSLASATGWAALLAVIYWGYSRYMGGAVAVALVTVSHWFLDAVVHRPDLPLYPGPSPLIGLGLWNSIAGTLLLESAMFAMGVWLYVSTTSPRNKVGRYALWGFVGFVAVVYLANALGPPPPSPQAIAWAGLSSLILPFWAYWFDKHRQIRLS